MAGTSREYREMRKNIRKKTRFEVLKRDSFRCQYCGRSAVTEAIVLHVDHIVPVVEGGTNAITNLITACSGCNLGKGGTPLADAPILERQARQLEQLQERRELMKLIVQWREELSRIDAEYLASLERHWNGVIAPLRRVMNDFGRGSIMRLLKRFSYEEVFEAMEIAAAYYGVDTVEDMDLAFSKIGGICFNRRRQVNGQE